MRDALLGLHPKDFDIATNASPDEIYKLFSNCRLIGRRFRLAHVRFGREIIEVATFRAAANHDHDDSALDQEGRILRDNVYGTIDEDVWRRDFTCNALYYNIADFSIWDYTDGMKDIDRRRIRLIGEPAVRLREDPVRMLRAVRFAAKLGFKIDKSVESAMSGLTDLLSNVPAARIFDEFLKLFQSGFAEKTFEHLWRYDLFAQLFPDTDACLVADKRYAKFVRAALISTDERVNAEKSVTPMFLIGVFLWGPIRELAAKMREKEQMSESHAISLASYEVSSNQQSRISIPRRFTGPMREMLALQPRLENIKGVRAMRLVEHRRFRAAYDFMILRAEAGDFDQDIAKFWTDVQLQDADGQRKSFNVSGKPGANNRRRRPRRRKASGAGET